MRRIAISLVLLGLNSGCEAVGSLFGDESEPTVDSRGEMVLPQSKNVGVVAADAQARPLALDVGQWTRYEMRHPDGSMTEIYRQVVAEESRGFWVEMVNGRPDAGTVTQLLVSKKPADGDQTPRILAARVRMPNSIIKNIEGPGLEATRSGYERLLSDMMLGGQPSGQGQSVKVPAGTFEGCRTTGHDFTFAGVEPVASACYHPQVPLGGLVQALDAAGRPAVVLTGFGVEGARSVLERKSKTR